jgi:hypothetical protein
LSELPGPILVWRLAPAQAEAEGLDALANELPSAFAWFLAAPRDSLGRLAAAIERLPKQPAWVPAWAYERALDAGDAQERLYRWALA